MQIMKSKEFFSFFYKYNQFASFLKLKSVLFKFFIQLAAFMQSAIHTIK